MEGLFLSLYKFLHGRRLVFLALIVLTGFFTTYFAARITLEEDISKSIPGEDGQVGFIINNSKLTNKVIIPVFSVIQPMLTTRIN